MACVFPAEVNLSCCLMPAAIHNLLYFALTFSMSLHPLNGLAKDRPDRSLALHLADVPE